MDMGGDTFIGQEFEISVRYVDSGATNNAACDMIVEKCGEIMRVVGNLFAPEILFSRPNHLENGRAYRYRYVVGVENRETYSCLGLQVLCDVLRVYARIVSFSGENRQSVSIDEVSGFLDKMGALRGTSLTNEESRHIQSLVRGSVKALRGMGVRADFLVGRVFGPAKEDVPIPGSNLPLFSGNLGGEGSGNGRAPIGKAKGSESGGTGQGKDGDESRGDEKDKNDMPFSIEAIPYILDLRSGRLSVFENHNKRVEILISDKDKQKIFNEYIKENGKKINVIQRYQKNKIYFERIYEE